MITNQFSKNEKEQTEPTKEPGYIESSIPSGTQQNNHPSIPTEKPKTLRALEYENMIAKSKTYHPFYKMKLSISGHAEYTDNNRRVTEIYFSATQNGQHVFTLKSSDLMRAGYDLRVLTHCSVQIKFYDYQDYITCNAPRQGVVLGGEQLASN